MDSRPVIDGAETFRVSVIDTAAPSRVVLFAVGAGGNPERHAPLLEDLGARGCAVVAPHFERIVSPRPTDDQLLLRARRLALALRDYRSAGVPIVGVGHSIGAALLLALAGAAMWTSPAGPLPIAKEERLVRLALLAPPTGFFQVPHALDRVHASLLVWSGTEDAITPPADAELLERSLGARVELRVTAGAGHFSFMNALPPTLSDSFAGRDALLAELSREIGDFVAA